MKNWFNNLFENKTVSKESKINFNDEKESVFTNYQSVLNKKSKNV